MSTVQKIILSILLSLFLFTSTLSPFLASKAYAQQTWYNQTFPDWFNRVYASPSNDVFGERYTAAQVQWIFYGITAFVFNGITGSPTTTACILKEKDLTKCAIQSFFDSIIKQFKIGTSTSNTGNPIGYIFLEDRPISGISYFRNTARNLHLVPKASAQSAGFGFTAFNPVLSLWRASRNVAYGILVIAILAISFMIMFRVKINPQTVISVQSSLPKITFALILITFSYAIAGFFVDLMYVFIGLLSLVLANGFQGVLNAQPGPMFTLMTQGPLNWGIFGLLLGYWGLFSIISLIVILGANGLGGLISGALTVIPVVGGTILWILMVLILMIVLLIATLRVIWLLLRTFAVVLLLVVAAPLQIALGVIYPQVGFGFWLKSFISNLAVFPLVGFLTMLAWLFLLLAGRQTIDSFLPNTVQNFVSQFLSGIVVAGPLLSPLVSNSGWPPLLSVGIQNLQGIIYLGVSLFILMVLPKTADIIKSLIEGRPFDFATAIGEATGVPRGLAITGLTAAGAPQEFLAKAKGTSPYLAGGTRERAVYALTQALRALLGGR